MNDDHAIPHAPAGDAVLSDSELDCLRCGHCCGPYFSLYVGEADEARWKQEGRQDLLDRLEYEREHVLWDEAGPFHNETRARFQRCVYLVSGAPGEFLCGIHQAKPKICRDYPPGSSSLCIQWRKGED